MMNNYFSIKELPTGWLIFISCTVILFIVILWMLIKASKNSMKIEPKSGTIINEIEIDEFSPEQLDLEETLARIKRQNDLEL